MFIFFINILPKYLGVTDNLSATSLSVNSLLKFLFIIFTACCTRGMALVEFFSILRFLINIIMISDIMLCISSWWNKEVGRSSVIFSVQVRMYCVSESLKCNEALVSADKNSEIFGVKKLTLNRNFRRKLSYEFNEKKTRNRSKINWN